MFRRPSLLSDISSLRSLSGSDGSAASASLGPSPLDEIAAPPRELASEEVEELSSLIRGCLKLTNCACAIQAEEDASDFIDYAVDLIADGLCVISVLEELAFMDMVEICPPQSLDEMHATLPAFLGRLHEKDGRENPCKALQASSSASASRGRRRLSQEIREGDTYLAAFDLSAKTAANKKRQELAAISGQDGSLKERIGSLQSSLANPRGRSEDNDALEGMDEAALKKKRERELNAIANDVSLTEKEKTNKMKEVQGKYGVLQMKMRIARAARARSIQSSGDEANKAEEAPKTSRAERELRPSKGRRSSIDLSASGAVATKAKELALLRKQSGSLADRKGMYAENGTLRNSFTNREIDLADQQGGEDEAKEKTIDDMRREELLKVMKDKSLSRMEKTRAMDEVRARYEEAATSAVEEALDEAIGKAKLAVGCGGDTVTTVSSITDHPFNNSGNDLANTGSAFSSSPIDEIAAPPRDLTEEELNDLRALIKGCLKLNNVSCALDADADAIDLVNYGIDLITDGMSVGVILEEIDFMELEICPMASLEELRKPLANYFGKLHKNATGTNPLDERAQKVVVSIPDREAARRRGRRTSIDGLIGSGVPRRRLSQEMREGSAFVKVDLSATTASNKKREELARLAKETGSIKTRMGMYSEDGKRDMEGAPLASSTPGKESVPRAERELRPGKGRRSSIDLSAKSSVVTKAKELALLQKQSGSLADRMGGMYAEDGTLRSRSSADKVEINHLGEEAQEKSTDELRREELLAVMRDRSLSREQKTRTMDLIREKYAPPEAIVGDKEQSSDEDNKSDKIEARRRKERVAIMRTKGLNTAERRARIEAVNRKQYCLTPSTRQ